MIGRLKSWLAWRRFQHRSHQAERRATATQTIGHIRQHRRAIVRAALEAGR